VLIRFACVALLGLVRVEFGGVGVEFAGFWGARARSSGPCPRIRGEFWFVLFLLAVAGFAAREVPFWVWGSRVSRISGLLRRRAIHLGLVL